MRRLTSPIFIGRAAELAELGGVAARVAAGRAATVIVGGEAGVGKTRFLAEFATAASATGALVLRGGCLDLGEGVLPYAPVVEALRTVADDGEEFGALLPELVPGGGIPAATRRGDQSRLFETALAVLGRLADRQPTVLILEDLHWADTSTRDMFGFLARNLFRERLLLVGSYRSDELHRRHPLRPFLGELGRLGVVRIDLPRFDRDEVRQQLAAIAGTPAEPDRVTRVFTRSEGNAFFAEELAAAGDGDGGALPATLRDILGARLHGVSDVAQTVLRAVAVAGRNVDEALLAGVAGLPEHALFEALRETLAHHVLVNPEAEPETYAFRHALLREAVYEDLIPGERRRLHRALAAWLQEAPDLPAVGGPGSRAERAHHWFAARQLPEALRESVAAAGLADEAHAWPEALAHYERALQLWEEVDGAQTLIGFDRVELARRAGVAAALTKDHRRAVTLFRAGLSSLDALADPLRAGELHALLIGPLVSLGDREAAIRAIATGSALVPSHPPTAVRSRLLQGSAQRLLYEDRYPEARAAAEEALAVARAAHAGSEADDALDTLVFATVFAGDVDGALAYARERLREAERDRDAAGIGRGWNEVGFVLQADLRFEEAADTFLTGAAALTELGTARSWQNDLECAAAEALRRAGRWPEADDLSRAVIERGGPASVQAHELRALLLPAMGRIDEAERHADIAWEATEGRLTVSADQAYHAARADIAIWRGDYEAARQAVEDGLALFAMSEDVRWIGELVVRGIRVETELAEIARAEQAAERCEDARARAKAILRPLLAVVRVTRERPSIFAREVDGPVMLARAEWSRLLGVSDPGRWRAAGEAWLTMRQPYQEAYARYREGEALLRRRAPRDEVAAVLGDARDTATRLGAGPLLAEIEALAARARVPLPERTAPSAGNVPPVLPPSDPLTAYRLTRREREVLALVALGRSDRQIADELFISDKTASVHVSNIKGKLGVETRVEAATMAARLGARESTPT